MTGAGQPAPESAEQVERKGLRGAQRAVAVIRAVMDDDGHEVTRIAVEAAEDGGMLPLLVNLAQLAAELVEAHPAGRGLLDGQALDLEMREHLLGVDFDTPPGAPE